ncbi:solute carrier family 2, facilitated glucose transporter member 5 isoform X2 [Poecilia latipinna]|uniref:solute carrier family 2, facilitated glucose transporter member 5 isoform X2 n=1 Tax=Poecilia latipinna TaxID=48699 RepID=UPI00072E6FB7|nr:PREDICTED: solute carrier family 2, facilitated glucose transporter member 5 isoform X2 [Poecilia latipinna]
MLAECVSECIGRYTMDEKQELENSEERKGRLTKVLVLASLVSAFGSSFQYGYNVAAVNSPAPFMQDFYNKTYISRYNEPMAESLLTVLWSVTVSMFPLGGLFGSLMVAPLVNKLGRKGTLLFNNIFSIVPAVMMGASEMAKSYELIILARILVGICAGLSSNVVPMYLGELAPKNLRGAIGIIPQLFITVGILVAQVFGIRSMLGNKTGWTIMLGLTAIPAVIQLIFLPFFPESPRYMLIQKRDEENSRKALKLLRGWEDVDEEIEEMRLEDQSEQAEGHLSVFSLLTQKSLRWQLLTIIVLNMGQQLSGVNAIYYYADNIYRSAGVNEQNVQYVTVGTGAVNVFMTIAAVFIVESSGRRLLLLLGFGICCGACVLLTVALNLQASVSWMPYISIICVIIYVMGHAIGPSPIPAVVTTEMFMQSARPAAFMLAGAVHWLSNFTVGLIFPFMERGLGPFSFLLFSVVCFVTLIYLLMVMPETKSKTFLEVSRLFNERNNMEIKIWEEDLKDNKEILEGIEKITAL